MSSVAAISGEGSGDKAACLFRGGNAEDALFMKRAEGRPMLAGGNSDQVLAQIADLYVATLGAGFQRVCRSGWSDTQAGIRTN